MFGGPFDPSTATTPAVQYAYNVPSAASSTSNNDRQTALVYPNGRTVDAVYSSGLDATTSRVSSLADDVSGTPGTTLEGYTYLGADSIVQRAHPQNHVNLTYINAAAATGNRYTGLDAFSRVGDQKWTNTSTGSAADDFQYGYDRDGDVLYKSDLVVPANSELYHANSGVSGDSNTAYDGLGRLTGFARGSLSASGNNGTTPDKIVSPAWTQSWTLDAWGNWTSQTTGPTTANRTFNPQNQTTAGPGTTPGYDNAGNEVQDTSGDPYTYDAWNRPVGHVNHTTSQVIVNYSYDALGRRIVASYPNAAGAPVKNLYYSADGEVIEERWNSTSSSAVKYQYVWSLAGDNTLVLRDQYASGTLSQRLYVEQDPNGNVSSITDTSGNVIERFLYDPYGTYTFMNPSGTGTSTNAVGWEFLFQGGRVDFATGRELFGLRDYIPFEGKWAQRDPLGQAAGDVNIYRFVGNDPIGRIDPSGLAEEPPGGWNWPWWDGIKAGTWGFFNTLSLGSLNLAVEAGPNFEANFKANQERAQANAAANSNFDAGQGSNASFPDGWISPDFGQNIMKTVELGSAATTPFRPIITPSASQFFPTNISSERGLVVGKAPNTLRQTGSGFFTSSADEAYNAIRASSTDVTAIAKNTGIKQSNIQKVKDHLFYQKHLLDRYVDLGVPAEMRRFDSDLGIANAWKRLELGTHTPDDIQLLRHEVAESHLMNRWVDPSYNRAHNRAQQTYRAPKLGN